MKGHEISVIFIVIFDSQNGSNEHKYKTKILICLKF